MAAKIIRKEGKKLIIEITIDLEDSMLDSEEAIQAVVNEAGSLATEEALKQFDTQGEAIEIAGKPWRAPSAFMTLKATGNIRFIWAPPLNRVKRISCAALPQRLSA
jgi:hypothetical protein